MGNTALEGVAVRKGTCCVLRGAWSAGRIACCVLRDLPHRLFRFHAPLTTRLSPCTTQHAPRNTAPPRNTPKFAALALVFAAVLAPISLTAQTNDQRSLILVIGAAGEPQYGEQFLAWADLWEKAAAKGGLRTCVVGTNEASLENDRTLLLRILADEIAKPEGELWLVFIGHGTFDGHSAKFNLRGPDISAGDLAAALKSCRRPLAVIQCASASGPFLPALSGPERVIITATRSGYEVNAPRFGGYLARAIADPEADLDRDGQTTLLEAFLLASREVGQYYKEKGLLQSEHALLDDNGDGLGTPPDWFHGARAVKTAQGGKSVDGVRAHQMILVRNETEQSLPPAVRARRDELEQKLSALRLRKNGMNEDDYYSELEKILVDIARLYQSKDP